MAATQNFLLSELSDRHREMLVPHLEAIDLPLRFSVEKTGKPVEHIYFPDSGMVSVVVDLAKWRPLAADLTKLRGAAMVEEMDVWRSAASMVKTYGDAAPMHCAELVERWAKRGDQEASETRRRIMEAARALAKCGSDGNPS